MFSGNDRCRDLANLGKFLCKAVCSTSLPRIVSNAAFPLFDFCRYDARNVLLGSMPTSHRFYLRSSCVLLE